MNPKGKKLVALFIVFFLVTEVEAITTTITYDPKTYEYTYPGGRLGGFYFSLGIGYNFNF